MSSEAPTTSPHTEVDQNPEEAPVSVWWRRGTVIGGLALFFGATFGPAIHNAQSDQPGSQPKAGCEATVPLHSNESSDLTQLRLSNGRYVGIVASRVTADEVGATYYGPYASKGDVTASFSDIAASVSLPLRNLGTREMSASTVATIDGVDVKVSVDASHSELTTTCATKTEVEAASH